MIDYRFKCPHCKDFTTVLEEKEGVIIISKVAVEDYASGPSLYYVDGGEEFDDFSTTSYFCADCGWKLPCKNADEVTDYLVDQEIERRF